MFHYVPMKGSKILTGSKNKKIIYDPVNELGKAVTSNGCIGGSQTTKMGNNSGVSSKPAGSLNFIAGEEDKNNGFWPGKWYFYHTMSIANFNNPGGGGKGGGIGRYNQGEIPVDQVLKTIVITFSFTIPSPHIGAEGSQSSGVGKKVK